jgi:cytochrome c oxidase subunit 2
MPCAACGRDLPQSVLDPAGPDARQIFQMHWVLTLIASAVSIAIIAATAIALIRRRKERGEAPPLPLAPSVFEKREREERETQARLSPELGAGMTEPFTTVELDAPYRDRDALRWVFGGGLIFPAVVLVGLFVYVMVVLAEVDRPAPPDSLTIDVVGWQFWWEANYYDGAGTHLLETANEIHIPVGTPVRVRLRSADVIHSFWIPRLAGKLDMIPGRTNEFSIQADSPGTYRGQCAEYCGLQHAKMSMLVRAQPRAEFDRWVAEQATDARAPSDTLASRGREVFLTSACAACHAVRGTSAQGNIGPDLTHVASRTSLASLAIPNTRGHMGGWIANPQAIKPGANMPAVPLSRDDYQAVLEYMMSLR